MIPADSRLAKAIFNHQRVDGLNCLAGNGIQSKNVQHTVKTSSIISIISKVALLGLIYSIVAYCTCSLATVIDGGSGRYHSAHLMKVDQIQTLKTEIESLKADQQKEKHYLRDTGDN